MLDLQKASAGSGKTYALARKYLLYLLTIDTPSGLRLRTREELEDSARHILAITFTNKATAEMKERIVARLDELTDWSRPDRETTYLTELAEAAGASTADVRAAAECALSILLNNYSDFQVSTIDAFFQTILRTFAYEIGLSDTYGLEMDSDFIAGSALDATLTDVNSDASDVHARKWITSLMKASADNRNRTWNLFAKSSRSGSLYSTIIAAIKKMSGEDFKMIRLRLQRFFESHPDTHSDFISLDTAIQSDLRDAIVRARKAAAGAIRLLPAINDPLDRFTASRLSKIAAATYNISPDRLPSFAGDTATVSPFTKKVNPDASPVHSRLTALYREALAGMNEYKQLYTSPRIVLWRLYRENLRLLPIMQYAARKSVEMLAESNIVDISETNAILRRVIGDDDAPFIYERLGSRLDHYLIDEFQDTSAMQWDNLRPLVDESMARGNGNLIIGDPKQSIYRFRNADPSLIVSRVPSDYADRVNLLGNSRVENTNYRSLRTIIETNNTIFHNLARQFDDIHTDKIHTVRPEGPVSRFFSSLYSNTVQYPHKQERRGYFRMEFIGASNADEDKIPAHFERLGPLITSLRERGYRQADIAILVRSNKTGTLAVKAITDYNMANPDKAIDVVSEESLLIEQAPSVKVILSVLALLAEGALTAAPDPENDRHHRTKMSMAMFNCRYQLAALRNPGMRPEQIIGILNSGPADDTPLRALLDSVSSLTLPALIEAIVRKFISPEHRDAEAPFIAAFQDIVLNYCESHATDILSFLQWWEIKGKTASISSPEGLDAVSVMTLHKSKGLEYQCVIIPYLKEKVVPDRYKSEWLWVRPDCASLGLTGNHADMMPDHIPVTTSEDMLDTPHCDEYMEYLRKFRMDVINNWYVAFTRTVAELYVFAAGDGTDDKLLSTRIARSLDADSEYRECIDGIPAAMITLEKETVTKVTKKQTSARETLVAVSIGTPLGNEEIYALESKIKESGNKTGAPLTLKEYFVSDPSDVLHYRNPESGYRHREDPDPRSRGNRLHDIMARVFTYEDLDRAILERRINGYLTPAEAAEASEILKEKMQSPQIRKWFSPGLRVINERTLLARNVRDRRPDRIIVDDKGHATVIDYKFGEHRSDVRYSRQVAQYMRHLTATGQFASVSGYIWYVMLDVTVSVDIRPNAL